jgi:hypothetical protein
MGLAMMPDYDMQKLKEMSQKGWHLSHLSGLLYRLEEGVPHDYDYAVNLESNITSEMLSIYEASGWTPIVAENGYQIFRADAGTTPIFSGLESTESEIEIEMLKNMQMRCVKWTAIVFSLIVVFCVVSQWIDIHQIILLLLLWILVVLFMFTVLPIIGCGISIYRKRKRV